MKLHFELHHYWAPALDLQPNKTTKFKEKCSIRISLLLCFLLKRKNMLECLQMDRYREESNQGLVRGKRAFTTEPTLIRTLMI
ncbi:hypothetical protein Y032_0100g3319 [Ancylostoma ceylanicum]|uniref:Uncharacterized protein n=1 Tax=Ancylostoma ceylanicum TaxID=53326 RepID=A0A016TIH9_9BILA|nr:hypothetical protein Y032_0100g3319 [Ancylostoma ceylanicum]